MTVAVADRPKTVLDDLALQAQQAALRRRAAARAGYETGLAKMMVGDPLTDDEAEAFHNARLECAITETEVHADRDALNVFRSCCQKRLRPDCDSLAEAEALRLREDKLRAELAEIRKRRSDVRAHLELASSCRTVRAGVGLRTRFSSLDFDALRERLEVPDDPAEHPDFKPTPSPELAAFVRH